jgi:hypothetical protein
MSTMHLSGQDATGRHGVDAARQLEVLVGASPWVQVPPPTRIAAPELPCYNPRSRASRANEPEDHGEGTAPFVGLVGLQL